MARDGLFADFDNKEIYDQSLALALDESTINFVVDFGRQQAQIAFNLGFSDIEAQLKSGNLPERPVRWMQVLPFPERNRIVNPPV